MKQVLRVLTSNQWRKYCLSIISCFSCFLRKITDWGFVVEECHLKSSQLKVEANEMVFRLACPAASHAVLVLKCIYLSAGS